MSEIEIQAFLKSVLDDLAVGAGLGRSNRKANDPLYRRYEYNGIQIEFGIVSSRANFFHGKFEPTSLREPFIRIISKRIEGHHRLSHKTLQDALVPLADPDYAERALSIISGAMSCSMHPVKPPPAPKYEPPQWYVRMKKNWGL